MNKKSIVSTRKVTVKVEVNQLYVDDKKMTNRFFFQIWYDDCFDHAFNFIGNSCLGLVKYGASDYLIWLKNGELRRTNLYTFMQLNNLDLSDISHDKFLDQLMLVKKVNINWLELKNNWLPKNKYFAKWLADHYTVNNKKIFYKEVEQSIKNCKDFYMELREHKIYLK